MRTIKKAKLTPLYTLEVEYEETIETAKGERYTMDCSMKGTWTPTDELITAMDRLTPHLAALCEQEDIEALEIWEQANMGTKHPVLEKMRVTGFTIGGSDEHEGVTLIGRRVLAGNRVLNLVAPFMKWQDEHNGYKRAHDVAAAIDVLRFHVKQYLDGVCKPPAQLEMEFAEEHA